MRNFLAAVLSVIAVGVLLIAYGLLAPRAVAAPLDNGGIVTLDPNRYPGYAAQPASFTQPASFAQPTYANERVVYVTRQTTARPAMRIAPSERNVARESRGESSQPRDWKKTALVIGGSTAAGAGVGGAVGGQKGALIGAALGGGVSTLFEALHK